MMTADAAPAVTVSAEDVMRVLDEIKDPCSVAASVPMGLAEMGMVKSVEVSADGHVDVEIRLTSPFCEMIAYLRNESLARVETLPGVTGVTVRHDTGFDWDHDMIAPEAQARRQARLARMREFAPRHTAA